MLLTYVWFQLWVAYAPCGSQHKDAVQITLEQIDLIKRFVEQYNTNLEFVTTSDGRLILILSLILISTMSCLCLVLIFVCFHSLLVSCLCLVYTLMSFMEMDDSAPSPGQLSSIQPIIIIPKV